MLNVGFNKYTKLVSFRISCKVGRMEANEGKLMSHILIEFGLSYEINYYQHTHASICTYKVFKNEI